MTQDVRIRKIREDEHHLLEDFTYEAIFLPESADPPPRSVLDVPEMRAYYEEFGREGDLGEDSPLRGRSLDARRAFRAMGSKRAKSHHE